MLVDETKSYFDFEQTNGTGAVFQDISGWKCSTGGTCNSWKQATLEIRFFKIGFVKKLLWVLPCMRS